MDTGAYRGLAAASEYSDFWAAIAAENEEVCRALADDTYRIPRGWYRAHRSITAGTCAHCGQRFRARQTIGYNSDLPGRHKVICGDCFHGA